MPSRQTIHKGSDQTTPATSPIDDGASANTIAACFAGNRVLVADDNPLNQTVAANLLEKLGCHPSVAADGAQAARMHADHPYDLVLMDCHMPELDGYQATARIRQMDREIRHTPIIALTASTAASEREKCLASGMDDFLAKPVAPRVLRDTLRRWLPLAPAVNKDRLDAMHAVFGDADFAALVALYRDDAPKRIDGLRHAARLNDDIELARVAHAFSGSCASIGASDLCAMCKELEAQAKSGSLDGIDQRLAVIEAEYDRVSAQLQSILAMLPQR